MSCQRISGSPEPINNTCTVIGQLTCWSDAEGLEDVLQAQLQTYAGMEEIESIASTCSRSINSRGESETSHGPYIHRLSLSKGSTPGDSAHSSPGGYPVHGALCTLCSCMLCHAALRSCAVCFASACCGTLQFADACCALFMYAVACCALLVHAVACCPLLWRDVVWPLSVMAEQS